MFSTQQIFLSVMLIGAAILSAAPAFAAKSGVDPQVISLPKGPGSIEGLGESFEPQLNTGTATYGVKIKLSPGVNKFQPEVALSYNGGYGSSAVGMGWELGIDSIQRQTDKGVPGYTDADTFTYAKGGEMVPIGDGAYRMKIEGLFMKFVKSGDSWEAWQKNGTHLFFGTAVSSRQVNTRGTFKWLLEKAIDTNGNEMRYSYTFDQGQVYLSEIRYSIMSDTVYKAVAFTYENRPNVVNDFRSRSKITTAKRLKTIDNLSQGTLVRRYALGYKQGVDQSLLDSVTQYGADGTTALPPLTFDYSNYSPSLAVTRTITNPPPVAVSLTASAQGNVDLIDINGDSLPDIVHTSPSDYQHTFYLNDGNSALRAEPMLSSSSPLYLLGINGVMMADMNGDGLADLYVKDSYDFGYFRNRGAMTWEEIDWTPCSPNPWFTFEDQNVRLIDVDNDKLIDAIIDNGSSYYIWLNRKDNQWSESFDYETVLPGGNHLSFVDPRTRFADMNGDRIQDLAFVMDDYVSYFPGMGNGEFGDETVIANPPTGLGALAGKLTTTDIDNNGLTDLVLVGNTTVTVWFNIGDSFKAPVIFENTPSFSSSIAAYRFADMNGDGFTDLLINDESGYDRYQYVDFANGTHPNMLTKISNGLGMETIIDYASSTDYYIADQAAGKPWTSRVPFPMQVVSKVTVRDLNSGHEYVTTYAYRDGYYDGVEKQFRGFAQVDKLTSGEAGAPQLRTRHNFDVGKDEESRKGLPTGLAAMDENGTVIPPSGLFEKEENSLVTRDLLTGTNGERVRFSFASAKRREIYEKGTTPTVLQQEFDQDSYGNTIKDFNYGIINGTDKSVGKDEILTSTDYYYDSTNWVLDRPKEVRKTTLAGSFVSTQKNSYDLKWNLTKQEGTVDGTTFIPLVRNQYDSYGNIIKITDANDHYRDIGYDTTFHTFPVSETIGGLGLTLTAGYDLGLGVITSYTDFNNNLTNYGYDPLGRLTSIVKPGDSTTYPTQSFIYTLANPVSSVLTKSRELQGQAGTYDSISYYDGLGRKLQTRSEGENSNWVVSDAVTFNKQKGIARKWLPHYATSIAYAVPGTSLASISNEYDAKGRSIRETNPDATFRTTSYLPLTTVEYDEEDNTVGGSHADTPHTFVNDGLGRLVEVRERNDLATYTTRYEYDGQNNLTKVTDNEGNIKTMVFDGLGRKTRMDDPDRHRMDYSYDPVGNLISTVDAKNQNVSYSYDVANRIAIENFGGVTKVRYHYDNDLSPLYPGMTNTKGKLAWIEDEAGSEYYSYDARGNTITKARHANGLTFINRMAYDSMDRLTSLTYPDSSIVSYQYNAMNQLEAIPGFVSAIDYEPTGKKSRFVYANGIESSYQYDSRQRMKGLKSSKGGATLQDLAYGYDNTSNIKSVTDGRTSKSTEDLTRSYLYDDLYRLTQATAPAWTESYQYSSIGNMTFKSDIGSMTYGANGAGPHALTRAEGANINYSYDANGNISGKQPGFTYSFDHKDRLAAANRAADGAKMAYSYDFGGNRVSKSVTLNSATSTTVYADKYTEVRGRNLIKNIFAGNRLVTRLYSTLPENGLLARNSALTVTDFDRNKDGVISLDEIRSQGSDPAAMENAEVADTLSLYYASLESNPNLIGFDTMAKALHEWSSTTQPGQKGYFYLPDHLGSASIVTDAAGAIVEESVYYPYGANRGRTGSFTSDYRFTGKELDDETGLHYFGARYYDSQVGRFVSVDPLGQNSTDAIGKRVNSAYSYAFSNPINLIDFEGLAEVDFGEMVKSTPQYEKTISNLATEAASFLRFAAFSASEKLHLTSLSDHILHYEYEAKIKGEGLAAQNAALNAIYGKKAGEPLFYTDKINLMKDVRVRTAGAVADVSVENYGHAKDLLNGNFRAGGELGRTDERINQKIQSNQEAGFAGKLMKGLADKVLGQTDAEGKYRSSTSQLKEVMKTIEDQGKGNN